MYSRRRFCRQIVAAWLGAAFCTVSAAQSREVPWLDEIQRKPQELPAEAPTLAPLLVNSQGQPITTIESWKAHRKDLIRHWQDFLGDMEFDPHYCPSLRVLEEDRDAGVIRQRVQYEVEKGVVSEAYLVRPVTPTGNKSPGVAVFHSTVDHSILQPAGLGADSEKAFGLKLAQRGIVTFSPRNFLWPDNRHLAANDETSRFQRRHPGVKGMAKMLYDAMIAVNILANLPDVDAGRLGAVGHSLGAKEVLYLAAFDERVRVTVSSEGGIGTRFSNWDAPWYLGPTIREPEFTHEHHELLGLVAPRAFLLIGGDSADGDRGWPFIEAALPVYRLHGGAPPIGQFNHKQGHAVPPECEQRIYEWFSTYL